MGVVDQIVVEEVEQVVFYIMQPILSLDPRYQFQLEEEELMEISHLTHQEVQVDITPTGGFTGYGHAGRGGVDPGGGGGGAGGGAGPQGGIGQPFNITSPTASPVYIAYASGGTGGNGGGASFGGGVSSTGPINSGGGGGSHGPSRGYSSGQSELIKDNNWSSS